MSDDATDPPAIKGFRRHGRKWISEPAFTTRVALAIRADADAQGITVSELIRDVMAARYPERKRTARKPRTKEEK